MVNLPDRSVFNYTEFNPRSEDAVSPNSAILCYFQLGEYSFAKSAICTILVKLLNEPFFDQLRNKEQLGYVVQCNFLS